MQIAMIGLGRMGANMSRRLMRAGHEVVVYDVNPNSVEILLQSLTEAYRLRNWRRLQPP